MRAREHYVLSCGSDEPFELLSASVLVGGVAHPVPSADLGRFMAAVRDAGIDKCTAAMLAAAEQESTFTL